MEAGRKVMMVVVVMIAQRERDFHQQVEVAAVAAREAATPKAIPERASLPTWMQNVRGSKPHLPGR